MQLDVSAVSPPTITSGSDWSGGLQRDASWRNRDDQTLPAAVAAPRILLVDDNEDLRDVMRIVLQSSGFNVIACGDAEEAEVAFSGQAGFDLLLTDLQMPGRSGAELAAGLVAHSPSLPVMIVSAAHPDVAALERFTEHGWCFLRKPFEVSDLLARVHTVIETGRSASSTGERDARL